MPRSPTTPGQTSARVGVPIRIAFRTATTVGPRVRTNFAVQWLAYALPYQRFADTLADTDA